MTIAISQIFGPTIQGEGSAAGQHCLFVRVFECNLACTWCDTAYTWAYTPERAKLTVSGIQHDKYDPTYGLKNMTPAEIIMQLKVLWDIQYKPTIIVISGGEPMMQQAKLLPLVEQLKEWGNEVHIETAGTIAPTMEFNDCVKQYNVSPKLEHSGNILSKRFKPGALAALVETRKAWFKFVVEEDWYAAMDEIDHMVDLIGISPRRVMIMPEGSDAKQNLYTAQRVVDAALRRGYGLSFRTHVLLWGDDKDK